MRVPSGTPTTLATVRPVNIMAMAPAFFSGATSSAATTDADAEEGAVREGGDDPPDEHDAEGRGERGEHVAGDEQAHQQHQHALAGDPGAEHGHQRSAEDHAEGVAGDQESRGGDRDLEVARRPRAAGP